MVSGVLCIGGLIGLEGVGSEVKGELGGLLLGESQKFEILFEDLW